MNPTLLTLGAIVLAVVVVGVVFAIIRSVIKTAAIGAILLVLVGAAVFLRFRGHTLDAVRPLPAGLSAAEAEAILAEATAEASLERLLEGMRLRRRLSAAELAAMLSAGTREAPDGGLLFRLSLRTGETWGWKADAARRLGPALVEDIERRMAEAAARALAGPTPTPASTPGAPPTGTAAPTAEAATPGL